MRVLKHHFTTTQHHVTNMMTMDGGELVITWFCWLALMIKHMLSNSTTEKEKEKVKNRIRLKRSYNYIGIECSLTNIDATRGGEILVKKILGRHLKYIVAECFRIS